MKPDQRTKLTVAKAHITGFMDILKLNPKAAYNWRFIRHRIKIAYKCITEQ